MISKIKNLIKFIINYIIDFFIKSSKEIKPKSLLLIRLDAIGDYVLFRNFINILKKDERYKNYKITLLGNIAWKALSEELDSEFIDVFIWINRNKFMKNFAYRYRKLQEIASDGYEIVLNPRYSREFFVDDNIVKFVNAKKKIGNIGDLSNMKKWQKKISDKYYDTLIPAKDEIMFEFYRNKEFFENLLDTKIDIKKPYIDLKPKDVHFELLQNYAILFIGAGADFRKWNIKNFAKVGMWLKDKYGYEIVLCGAPGDKKDSLEFSRYFRGNYIDLVGRTSLIDLMYIIQKANLIISNETSAPHLAVALEMKNIFVVSNGNHYGRFTPYPKDIAPNYHVIFHPEIEKDLDNYKKLINKYGYGSRLDINDITVEKVKEKIKTVLK